MQRIETVRDLINALEDLPDDMPIMAQHQPNWPLREVIGGIWVDDGKGEDYYEAECEKCEHLTLGEVEEVRGNNETHWFRKCFHCDYMNEVEPPTPDDDVVAYVVLNGHPYYGSPYGDKRAWNEI